MTALAASEKIDKHKDIKVTKEMLAEGYGASGNLRRGETLTAGELFYPLLLSSSNDAAYVSPWITGKITS